MRHFLISENGLAREVWSPFHPCDARPARVIVPAQLDQYGNETAPAVLDSPTPEYEGPRENVVDVDADPQNPAWLRYRGLISDETYDRLKAEGLVELVDGRVEILDKG
jgi:hypothetical protein